MSFWKGKVFPKIRTTFHMKKGSSSSRAVGSDAACRVFDGSKEEVSREIEEKKEELRPKVLKIYNACSEETQTALRNPAPEDWVKNHSNADDIKKLLEQLVKIEFPGSKQVYDASTKYSPTLVSRSIVFIFEKVADVLAPVEKSTEKVPEAVKESSVMVETHVIAVAEMPPKAVVSSEEEEEVVIVPKAVVSEEEPEVMIVAPKAKLTKEEEEDIVPEMPKAVETPKVAPTREETVAEPVKVNAETVEISSNVVEVPKEKVADVAEVVGEMKVEVTKEEVAEIDVPKEEPSMAVEVPVTKK